MRSKKLYIILIAIVIVFFVVMFLMFGTTNILQEQYQATLIVGNHTVWNYRNKRWNNLILSNNLQQLNWQKYEVYLNNEKFGNYYLWHDDRWYLFDDDHNPVSMEGDLLAYVANYDLNVKGFSEDDSLDLAAVQNVLYDRNIPLDSLFTNQSHVAFDFDSDGVVEDFYLITNVFAMDFDPDSYFSFVFMVKENRIYMIYDDVTSSNSFNGCKPFFTSFLDVNHDHIYEFILSCGRYSIEEQVDMLYQFDEGAFKIVISNQ